MPMFGFGAEHLGEMNSTMVRRTIESNGERLMACDPGVDYDVPVDLQLMVEPGGTTVSVFVGVEPWSVGQCLIDAFTDILFPFATGSPVAAFRPEGRSTDTIRFSSCLHWFAIPITVAVRSRTGGWKPVPSMASTIRWASLKAGSAVMTSSEF